MNCVILDAMDVMDAIYHRRSVRRFTGDAVLEEEIRNIISAGMMAPSAGNRQPWHFVVITDPKILAKAAEVNPNARMAAEAPLAILVCGDTALEMRPGYWIQDCSAAVENMLLAVHAAGLGAVWTGTWPVPERVEGFRNLLKLPPTVNPLALLVIGHPAEGAPSNEVPDRFIGERIHREEW